LNVFPCAGPNIIAAKYECVGVCAEYHQIFIECLLLQVSAGPNIIAASFAALVDGYEYHLAEHVNHKFK